MRRILLVHIFLICQLRADFLLDFTKDRDVNRILQEVPVFTPAGSSVGGRKLFSMDKGLSTQEDINVSIKLPEKGIIKVRTWFITLDAENEKVISLRAHSGIMPLDEAYQASLEISTAMNLQTERILKWHKEASTSAGADPCLLTTFTYPKVEVSIRSSFSSFYPYMLSISIHWSDRLGGPSAVPPPFPEHQTVSLNPPSGRVYDPMDEILASKEENERQMEEWLRHHPDQADKVRQEIARRKQEAQNSPDSAVARLNSDKSAILPPASRPFPWLLPVMILGGLVILGFTVRALRIKQG